MKIPIKKVDQPVAVPEKKTLILSDEDILEARDQGKITAREGQHLFMKFVNEKFPEDILASMLHDLATANDIRMTKMGPISTPNWGARKDGLKMALAFKGRTPSQEFGNKPKAPRFVFNVVPAKGFAKGK